jgi:hypothetical protein
VNYRYWYKSDFKYKEGMKGKYTRQLLCATTPATKPRC